LYNKYLPSFFLPFTPDYFLQNSFTESSYIIAHKITGCCTIPSVALSNHQISKDEVGNAKASIKKSQTKEAISLHIHCLLCKEKLLTFRRIMVYGNAPA
jgi:hypothetical protein